MLAPSRDVLGGPGKRGLGEKGGVVEGGQTETREKEGVKSQCEHSDHQLTYSISGEKHMYD